MGIRWNDKTGRFVDTTTNLALSPSKVMSALNQTLLDGEQKLLDIADQLFNGDIDLLVFADQVADTLKVMHLSEALRVKKGVESLTVSNLKAVSSVLKSELIMGIGVDENGDKTTYGIMSLIDDIRGGKLTVDRLKQRLKLYADSASKSATATEFSDSEDDDEISECLNVLNKVKTSHHPICIEATARGWMTLKEMKDYGLPKRHAVCHCTLIYR